MTDATPKPETATTPTAAAATDNTSTNNAPATPAATTAAQTTASPAAVEATATAATTATATTTSTPTATADSGTPPQPQTHKCWSCGTVVAKLDPTVHKQCSRCQQVVFCSAQCFKKGWRDHKKHCNVVAVPIDHEPDAHTRAAKSRQAQQEAAASAVPVANPQIIHAKTNPSAPLPEGFVSADTVPPEQLQSAANNSSLPPELVTNSTTTTASADGKPKLMPGTGKANITGDAPVAAKDQARLQAMIGSGRGSNIHTVSMKTGVNATLTSTEVPEGAAICFIDCTDCQYRIEAPCVKIFLQGCTGLQLHIVGKVITSTMEIFHCEGVKAVMSGQVHTVQADMNRDLDLAFPDKETFRMIVWAGCYNFKIQVGEFELLTGFDIMKSQYKNLREDISQFKISMVHDKLMSERVVRLDNGFPTTKREADEFDRRQEENIQRRAKEMGITIKRKAPTGPKVGRNDPCPCGSGRKYKACCLKG
ncbi:hypothetical protein Pelo_9302 [Pelomyxa schiedti]|nr:hypothetical protein Pelo_9302 [Pelomyxa schiedti]